MKVTAPYSITEQPGIQLQTSCWAALPIKLHSQFNKRVNLHGRKTTSFHLRAEMPPTQTQHGWESEGSWDEGCLTQKSATVSSGITTSFSAIPRNDPLASLLATCTQSGKSSHLVSLCSWGRVSKKHRWWLQELLSARGMHSVTKASDSDFLGPLIPGLGANTPLGTRTWER